MFDYESFLGVEQSKQSICIHISRSKQLIQLQNARMFGKHDITAYCQMPMTNRIKWNMAAPSLSYPCEEFDGQSACRVSTHDFSVAGLMSYP